MTKTGSPEPLDLANRVISLFEAIHPLDRVPRAGFLLRGVPEPESVSAHCHFLAVIALIYTDAFPESYNKDRVIAMALVHDLAEALLMDIPMPYADAYLKGAKQRAEHSIMQHLFQGFSGHYVALHEEFDAQESPEALLLRGLDKAQMMLKVLNYDRERRGCMDEFWKNPKNFRDFGIEAVSVLFDRICALAGKTRPT